MEKKSISVPEMQRMLGLKKVAAYWLVKQGRFDTIMVGGKMRIMVNSFEAWYQGQSRYRKREDAAPLEVWQSTWSVREVANLLGVHRNVVYGMVNDRHLFPKILVDGHIRIDKEDFEDWYCSQDHYKKIEKEV